MWRSCKVPKQDGTFKGVFMCTRITSPIKELILEEAKAQGLTPSEWLRHLILRELKERRTIPRVSSSPDEHAAERDKEAIVLKN